MTPPEPHITEQGTGADEPLVRALQQAFARALRDESPLPEHLLALPGMSGRRYRHFVNNLVALAPAPRYLEIGCWAGSTLCAALHGNRLRAFAIDNWSEFGGPSQQFLRNVAEVATAAVEFNLLTADFRRVNYRHLGRFNLFLFDGPHTEQDQYDGVVLPLAALDDTFVLIVDDWNWPAVRAGTFRAIRDLGLATLHAIEVRTTQDDSHPAVAMQHSHWHNGYFLAVLRQPPVVSALIA